MPEEEWVEVEAPVLTPSPLNRWTILGGFLAVTGSTVQHAAASLDALGELIGAFGVASTHHWVAAQERRAFEAAVVTEIEKITEG